MTGTELSPRRLLRPEAASNYLGIAASTLAKYRCRGCGPPYIKVNHQLVLYDPAELDAWLDARRCGSTSEAVA